MQDHIRNRRKYMSLLNKIIRMILIFFSFSLKKLSDSCAYNNTLFLTEIFLKWNILFKFCKEAFLLFFSLSVFFSREPRISATWCFRSFKTQQKSLVNLDVEITVLWPQIGFLLNFFVIKHNSDNSILKPVKILQAKPYFQ